MTSEDLQNLLGIDINFQSAAERQKYLKAMHLYGLDPNAYYQEIEMSSPYVNTHSDTNYHYEAMALHSHAFYEILCCRSSCGAEYLVGSRRYALQKGDIILVRPGVSHCAILPDPLPIPYKRDIIWLSAAFQDSFQRLLGLPPVSYEKDLPTYLIRTAGTPWEFLCDKIHEGVLMEKKQQYTWQTMVLGNTMMVISYLRQAYQSQTAQPLHAEAPDLLDDIIAYLEAHYQEKLVMAEVAKQFFISERTISTLFRKRLGITFGQFLTQRRLVEAKSLILKGTTLDLVAQLTGFADYSTFYRAFRKEFGIAPLQFRKNNIPSEEHTILL